MPGQLIGGIHGALASVCAATLVACAAGPEKSAAADETAVTGQEKICKSVKVTGSHIPRRVCKTPEEIEREQEAAREIARRAQEQASIQTSGAGGN